MFGQKKDKLLAPCENCGCRRYTKCGCQIGDPNSSTQKKRKHRKEIEK